MEKERDENVKLNGIYHFTKARIETAKQWSLHNEIQQLINEGKDYIYLVRKLNSICTTEEWKVKNIIPTSGRTLIANNLTSSTPTDSPRVNYTALGTGIATPANGDIILGTEVYRRQRGSATNAANIAYITAFYTAPEVVGTFTEAGLFANGTSVVNSGVLFSRVLLNGGAGIVKTNIETLTIDYTVSLN